MYTRTINLCGQRHPYSDENFIESQLEIQYIALSQVTTNDMLKMISRNKFWGVVVLVRKIKSNSR